MVDEAGALLRVLDAAQDLRRVPRMGWLLAGVAVPESVAEHSFGVAMWTLLLAAAVNGSAAADDGVDADRAVRLALMHDLAESVLTDLPKRSAELLGSDVKRRAEAAAVEQLLAPLAHGEELKALWAEYDAAATREAHLVKDADKLDMVHQALHYERCGQRNLEEFWTGHRWYFDVSRSLFDELCRNRSQDRSSLRPIGGD